MPTPPERTPLLSYAGKVPLLAVAAIFAVLAALVAFLAVKQRSDEIAHGWKPVYVLVAARDMREGETLSRENLKSSQIPSRLVTPSVITETDVAKGTPVYGRKLAMEMHQGDPLLYQHVQTRTGEQHLAEAVQTQGRAIAIRVSPESSVQNWVEPGDRVDVIGVFHEPRSQEMVSATMLQNVIVLATGRIGGRTNRRLLSENDLAYNTVTLQVLPEAVEMLVLAQDLGSLYLSLRSPEDTEIADLGESKTTMTTLLTGERSKRLNTTQSKLFRVQIIRRGHTESQAVP